MTPSFIYRGQFKDGLPHGIGVKYTGNKEFKLIGVFDQGMEVKTLTINFPKATFQESNYENGNLSKQKEVIDTNEPDYRRKINST